MSIIHVNVLKVFWLLSVFSVLIFFAGTEEHHRSGILSALQRSLSKEYKVVHDGSMMTKCKHGTSSNLGLALVKYGSNFKESAVKGSCSFCSTDSLLLENTCAQSAEESSADGGEGTSMAIVPVQKLEGASSSISLLMKELPELKSGWSFLRRFMSSHRKAFDRPSLRQISVVQWEMQLPSRSCLSISDSDEMKSCFRCNQGQYSELNKENGAIVPVGNETVSCPSSPSASTRSLPEELEGLHEKYSATCRLFQYEELVLATSKFKPGLFLSLSLTNL